MSPSWKNLLRCLFILGITASSLTSCTDDDVNADDDPSPNAPSRWDGLDGFEVSWRLNDLTWSNEFAQEATARGESTMPEASGIVASIKNPGYLWSHNDKGNENLLFLLDKASGQTVARYRLEGILNRDWEDIELGRDDSGETYIYLGEVGDNNRVYPSYSIHRFVEPKFEEAHRGQVVNHQPEGHTDINFVYPEGKRHDVETLLFDPIHKDLYLVTKRDFNSIIYAIPYQENYPAQSEALFVGEFRFTRAVGGNVSFDGSEVLIKTYDRILHWKRDLDKPLWQTLMEHPHLLPYFPGEPQGEAICFDTEGESFYTLSEFSNSITPILYHYQRLSNQ